MEFDWRITTTHLICCLEDKICSFGIFYYNPSYTLYMICSINFSYYCINCISIDYANIVDPFYSPVVGTSRSDLRSPTYWSLVHWRRRWPSPQFPDLASTSNSQSTILRTSLSWTLKGLRAFLPSIIWLKTPNLFPMWIFLLVWAHFLFSTSSVSAHVYN